jgi:hypothetical protein
MAIVSWMERILYVIQHLGYLTLQAISQEASAPYGAVVKEYGVL